MADKFWQNLGLYGPKQATHEIYNQQDGYRRRNQIIKTYKGMIKKHHKAIVRLEAKLAGLLLKNQVPALAPFKPKIILRKKEK